jgi:NADPH-dependent 2,4-dienoyl-CoA reductase/sulfur reductase-like enzyme/ferredoxin
MIGITINGQQVEVPEGTTLLQAARLVQVNIPTLCFLEGLENHTSCMVCVVEETNTGRLLPACSAKVETGMAVQTDSEPVFRARQSALDLLLSEHVGDCEGPCRLICPAHMNIPRMIRQIAAGDFRSAVQTVRERIAIPAILGRICPAPCENGCRRKTIDDPVSICLLKRFTADTDLFSNHPQNYENAPDTGKRVVVVGAGPAGLSTAYYLRRMGHDCTVLDAQKAAGGQLRNGVSRDLLPESVLNREIGWIAEHGITFRFNTRLDKTLSIHELRSRFDAVVLTIGDTPPETVEALGLEKSERGIRIHPATFETSLPGVFAGGNAVQPGKLAVRSAGHGWAIAQSVHQAMNAMQVTGPVKLFQSRIGPIQSVEIPEFQKEASIDSRQNPSGGVEAGLIESEAVKEALRCLHCDCRKPESCSLRRLSGTYDARAQRYRGGDRFPVEKVKHSGGVIYEPGKCIKCGICVRITSKAGEKLGLTFTGRGFLVKVDIPFHESLEAALEKSAVECVKACPTGALAFIHQEEVL